MAASQMHKSQEATYVQERLTQIVGPENVLGRHEQVAEYFPKPADTGTLVAVRPARVEEVQEILRLKARTCFAMDVV